MQIQSLPFFQLNYPGKSEPAEVILHDLLALMQGLRLGLRGCATQTTRKSREAERVVCHPVGTSVRYDRGMPRYNWYEVQRYHDQNHSRAECMARFGFSSCAWTDAKKRGAVRQRKRWENPETLPMIKTRSHIKRMLLEAGMIREKCYECGLTHWLGSKLTLHIDHINGIGTDNRLENLRMLCPNCHSQTDTFSGRNVRRNGRYEPPS